MKPFYPRNERQHKVFHRFFGHQGSSGYRFDFTQKTQRRKRQRQIWKEDVRICRNLNRVNETPRQPNLRAGETGYLPTQVVSLRIHPPGN